MSYYTPDRWVIVRIDSSEGQIDKILSSWYGGFAGSDEWRFSSGITKIEEVNDGYPHYLIHNHSGSIYTCHKNNLGMSAYTSSVYLSLKKKVEETGGSMEVIDIVDILS